MVKMRDYCYVTGRPLDVLRNQYALSMLQNMASGPFFKEYRQAKYREADPRNNALKAGVQMIGGSGIRGAVVLLLMRITSNYYFFFASSLTSMLVAFI